MKIETLCISELPDLQNTIYVQLYTPYVLSDINCDTQYIVYTLQYTPYVRSVTINLEIIVNILLHFLDIC